MSEPLRASRLRATAVECGWIALFAVLTAAMTWPWVLHLKNAVSDPGDPYLNAWILHWDYQQFWRHPLHLFEAPNLFPYKHTLAMSENLFGMSILLWPLYALGIAPVTGHVVAELLGIVLCGYAAFRICRTAFGSTGAAVVGGIVFGFTPFRLAQLPHVQMVFAAWIPLVLEALILFLRKRSWRRAVWLGVAFLMNGLTCVHWLVLSLFPLAVAAVLVTESENAWSDRRGLFRGLLAIGIACMILRGFLQPYRDVVKLYGLVRNVVELEWWSGFPTDWINFAWNNRLYHGLHLGRSAPEGGLSPGVLPIVAALSGLFLCRARPASPSPEKNGLRGIWLLDALIAAIGIILMIFVFHGPFRWKAAGVRILRVSEPSRLEFLLTLTILARLWIRFPRFVSAGTAGSLRSALRNSRWPVEWWIAAAWLAVSFAGSLGTHFFFHRVLFDVLDIFRSIRVPTRWAMIGYVGIALLAAFGAREVLERFSGRRSRLPVLVGLSGLLLFEYRVAPLDYFPGELVAPPVYEALRTVPMHGGIVEIPTGQWQADSLWTLRLAHHGRPLVTGSSGFRPPILSQIIEEWQENPIDPSFQDLLESVPTSYVVVHGGMLDDSHAMTVRRFTARMVSAGRLTLDDRYPEGADWDELYRVVANEPVRRAQHGDRSSREMPSPDVVDETVVGFLDMPQEGDDIRGSLQVRGWAASPGAATRIRVQLDSGLRQAFAARYPRPDVSAVRPEFGSTKESGFFIQFEPPVLSPDEHTLTVDVETARGRKRIGPVRFRWRQRYP